MILLTDYGSSASLPFSAIFLQSLAMRPVHEYNVTMGGDAPQVPVISKLAMSDQRHNGITSWHSSQVEGLVGFISRAGSSPVSGTAIRARGYGESRLLALRVSISPVL